MLLRLLTVWHLNTSLETLKNTPIKIISIICYIYTHMYLRLSNIILYGTVIGEKQVSHERSGLSTRHNPPTEFRAY